MLLQLLLLLQALLNVVVADADYHSEFMSWHPNVIWASQDTTEHGTEIGSDPNTHCCHNCPNHTQDLCPTLFLTLHTWILKIIWEGQQKYLRRGKYFVLLATIMIRQWAWYGTAAVIMFHDFITISTRHSAYHSIVAIQVFKNFLLLLSNSAEGRHLSELEFEVDDLYYLCSVCIDEIFNVSL